MEQDEISFNAEFASGYFIRKMFDSCKDLFVNMTIVFHKDGIKCYSLSNDSYQYVDINLTNIPGYQFKAGTGAINQEAKYVVNIKNLVSHIKTVTRGMKLIFKKEVESSKLILMYGSDNNSCTWFESMIDNNQDFAFPELINTKPVCFLDFKEFKTKLTKPSIIGCKSVQIDSYATHILIQAIANNNPEGYMAKIGSETTDVLEERVYIPAAMLKHISKQADVCRPGDNIYIFVQPSYTNLQGIVCPTFIMFQTSIGTYGNIKLYIATQSTN
jgi:hypothetical protein